MMMMLFLCNLQSCFNETVCVYIIIITALVVTKSLCGFVAN